MEPELAPVRASAFAPGSCGETLIICRRSILRPRGLGLSVVPIDITPDALLKTCHGRVPEQLPGFADVRVGKRHISGLFGKPADSRALPECLLDRLYHCGETYRLGVA